jgi:cell division protein FtsL
MTDDDEKKIVNLRGIAIVTAFIISGIILYLQTSEWQVNSP